MSFFGRLGRKAEAGVFAFDTAFNTLHWYRSAVEAISDIQGLEVAEGDWRFFAADGSPLEARFSVPARINFEKNTYSNGVYTLEPGTGASLQEILPSISSVSSRDFRNVLDVKEFLSMRRKSAG